MVKFLDHRKNCFYVIVGIAAILISSLITTPSNPQGIFISYLGAIFFVLAFTHTLVSAGSCILLSVISAGVAIISITLNNLLGEAYQDTFLDEIRKFLFFLTIFISPFGLIIGIVGSILFSVKSEQK